MQQGTIGRLTATDISPGMLDQLAATAAGLGLADVTTVVTEAEMLPFDDESFDLVLATPSSTTSPTSTGPSPSSSGCCGRAG